MRVIGAHLFTPALFMVVLFGPGMLAAQAPANPPASPPPQAMKTPSAIMQPSLDALQQILDVLQPEKWKASGRVREETSANINSIRRDLTTTLPPLLATADSAPDSVARALPAYRNIEALYDVLLRVTETSKLAAPSQQAVTLAKTLASLEDGRRALGEQIQAAALNRDQQLHDLQAAVRTAQHAPAPAPVTCPPPPRTKKRSARSKTAHKSTASPKSSQSETPSH